MGCFGKTTNYATCSKSKNGINFTPLCSMSFDPSRFDCCHEFAVN